MLTDVFEGLKHVFEERVRYSRLRKLAGLHAADDGKKVVNGSLGVIAGAVVVAEMPALVTVPGVGRESKSFVDSDRKCYFFAASNTETVSKKREMRTWGLRGGRAQSSC
jgi:hypothetical protein